MFPGISAEVSAAMSAALISFTVPRDRLDRCARRTGARRTASTLRPAFQPPRRHRLLQRRSVRKEADPAARAAVQAGEAARPRDPPGEARGLAGADRAARQTRPDFAHRPLDIRDPAQLPKTPANPPPPPHRPPPPQLPPPHHPPTP